MVPWEPHLSKIGGVLVTRQPLPHGRAEGWAVLIQGERVEGMLNSV